MRIDIVTIFPRIFETPLDETIIGRARERGLVEFHLHDIRDFATDRHRSVDDAPYGGGPGMVMTPGPITAAVEAVPRVGRSLRVLLTPKGERLEQGIVRELASYDQLILVCGRYEGIDERARRLIAEREISVGDYVTSGGEIPALVLIDAVVRLIPGALGNEASASCESFESGLLEHPQYTRPEVFRGERVPEVLLGGNHAEIERWRRAKAIEITAKRRPDLIERANLTEEEKEIVRRISEGRG